MMVYRNLAFGLFAWVLLLSPTLVESQTSNRITWSNPERIGQGWWQSIAVDRRDFAHVTWYGVNEGGKDALMYDVRDHEGNWQPVNDIVDTDSNGVTVRNTIQVSSDGVLYAAYRHAGPVRVIAAPADQAWNASNWTTSQDVTTLVYYNSLYVGDDNTLHLAFSGRLFAPDNESIEINPCLYCHDLYYIRSVDHGRTWSSPVPISEGRKTGSDQVEIFRGEASGRLYITWDEGYDFYIGRGQWQDSRIAYSEDNGLTWSDPVIITGFADRTDPIFKLDLTELADGSLLAVWRYVDDRDHNIYYQTSVDVGQTWSDPSPVPGIEALPVAASVLDSYDLITDLDNVAHLFAVGYKADGPDTRVPSLMHFEYRQNRWVGPETIYYDPTVARPEWPKAAIGPQNDIHLTWFVASAEAGLTTNDGEMNVYYSHRTGNKLDVPLLVAYPPTPIPLPAPTKVPEFVPTPTLLPTMAPLDPNLTVNSNQDLYATTTLLAAFLAVMLLCVVVLVLSGFRPRL